MIDMNVTIVKNWKMNDFDVGFSISWPCRSDGFWMFRIDLGLISILIDTDNMDRSSPGLTPNPGIPGSPQTWLPDLSESEGELNDTT